MSSQRDTFGEPRHPSAAILDHGEYWAELGDLRVHRCGGAWKIVGRFDDLPAGAEEGDTPSLCIDGIRKGDTEMEPVTISSIDLTEGGRFKIIYTYDGELPALDRWLEDGCLVCGTEPAAQDDAPTTHAIADTLDVEPERLEAFVDAFGEGGPTPAAVLGWATAEPGAVDEVAAWLESHDSGVNL